MGKRLLIFGFLLLGKCVDEGMGREREGKFGACFHVVLAMTVVKDQPMSLIINRSTAKLDRKVLILKDQPMPLIINRSAAKLDRKVLNSKRNYSQVPNRTRKKKS